MPEPPQVPLLTVQAVTFDLDGTLYASRPFRTAYVRANFLRLRTIRTARRVREELRGLVFPTGEALFAEQTRLIAQRLGRREDVVRAQVDELFGPRVCAALRKTGPRPEAREALLGLVGAGLQIAVISDFRVEDKLEAIGLHDLPWTALIATEAEGALKPHPRAFERAAVRLSVPVSAMVHVGDRDDTDGRGARAAGMGALLVGTGGGGPADLAEAAAQILRGRDRRD